MIILFKDSYGLLTREIYFEDKLARFQNSAFIKT